MRLAVQFTDIFLRRNYDIKIQAEPRTVSIFGEEWATEAAGKSNLIA